MCHWIAVRVPGQRERVIAQRLEREIGAVIYLPLVRERPQWAKGPLTVPLFKTYIFADIDAGRPHWAAIRRHHGVIGLVMADPMTPGRCPSAEIEKLKAAEIDGVVQLAGEPPPPSSKQFAAGQRVKIQLDAFDGKEAHYVSPARRNMSRVTVTLLNRVIEVSVPTHRLAEVAEVAA